MKKEIEDLKLEEAMTELEELVSVMQDGDIDLEDSVELYKRGMLLKKHCDNLLKETENKIEKITKNSDGEYETKKF